MTGHKLLQKQVREEMKRRRLVVFTAFVIVFTFLTINLLFGDMGLFRYMELQETRLNLERQIEDINSQNQQLRTQLQLLKEDAFYREKLAREEFGMAKPDEFIFKYDK